MSISEPGPEVWNKVWSERQDLQRVYPSSPSVQKNILSHLDVKGLRILEVGAGSGRDSAELARRGAFVTVLDFAPRSLQLIAGLRQELSLQGHLELVRGDAFHAPFADNTFDLVFHQGLAEHFQNPLPLLQENFRLVKPGGHCLCDVPQTIHLYTVMKKILIALDRWFAGWETQFTMPELKRLMQDAGFEIAHAYGDWMRPSLLYRVLRELAWKIGIDLPKYPLDGTAWNRWKNQIMDSLESKPLLHYTQLSIGVLGVKPNKVSP